MGRRGQASKYDPERHPILARALAREGLTNIEIAKRMGVSRATLINWRRKYPEMLAALKEGKDVIDAQVESALLRRALGYEYEETEISIAEDGKKKRVKKVKKSLAPDVTAQIFWLKNRQKEKWRESVPEPRVDKSETLAKLVAAMEAAARAVKSDI
jgi:transposase